MAEAEKNEQSTMLVIVDPQVDFHEGGSLAVAGAKDDSKRLATWIEREGKKISDITVTLDTHKRHHVGHGVYWINDKGEQPAPFTLIKSENLKSNGGEWQAKNEADRAKAEKYVKDLEATNKFVVCIWPEHCIEGTPGHEVVPVLKAALKKWEELTSKKVSYLRKGQNSDTEMYSALKAEIPVESDDNTKLNTAEITRWDAYDRVVFCGEAQSHCVNFTCTDFNDNKKKAQVIVLTDCQSNVGGFEESGKDFFDRMKKAEATLVKADDLKL